MARVPVLYTEQDTVLHRRDPRVKVMLFVLLFAFLFTAPSWQWMLILTSLGAVTCVLARVPVKYLLWALVIVQLPNFIGILSIPVIGDLREGALQYDKAMADGLKLVFAWAGALLLSFGLFSTMKVDELTDGLRGLRLPEAVCFAVGYAFLLLYLSLSDIFRITDTMKIKGVDLETKNPFRLLMSAPRLMIPALFTTVRRGMTMIAVLEMRGFSFSQRRKTSKRAKFDFGDATLLFCGLFIFGVALSARLDLLPLQFSEPEEEKEESQQPAAQGESESPGLRRVELWRNSPRLDLSDCAEVQPTRDRGGRRQGDASISISTNTTLRAIEIDPFPRHITGTGVSFSGRSLQNRGSTVGSHYCFGLR